MTPTPTSFHPGLTFSALLPVTCTALYLVSPEPTLSCLCLITLIIENWKIGIYIPLEQLRLDWTKVSFESCQVTSSPSLVPASPHAALRCATPLIQLVSLAREYQNTKGINSV
jgi:hypothetical protein